MGIRAVYSMPYINVKVFGSVEVIVLDGLSRHLWLISKCFNELAIDSQE